MKASKVMVNKHHSITFHYTIDLTMLNRSHHLHRGAQMKRCSNNVKE